MVEKLDVIYAGFCCHSLVFSKSGQLISERRSRLAAKNVQKVLVLNANIGRH